MPIDEAIIEYYLSFLEDPESARRRAKFISLDDPEPRSLTAKVLDRPEIVDEIRAAAGDPERAFIVPFNMTELERTLSERLGIAVYGPHPELVRLGSKSGSRQIAREAGVAVLPGAEDLTSVEELEKAIAGIRSEQPGVRSIVIKLNNGFSGQGNAILDVAGIATPLASSPTVFCAEAESWTTYARKIEAEGAVVEQLIQHPDAVSPSVQLRIVPGGSVEVLSTHDQVLGDPDDQVYLGCRFPARADYRTMIQEQGRRIAKVLAARGVIGSFGVDFVVVPDGLSWRAYLSEINLRLGGTTHPFLMARRATRGTYDEASGELLVEGSPRTYVSSDNLKSPAYVGLTPADVIKALEDSRLGFDRTSATGVTLHLMGALHLYGKVGVVCIGETLAHSDALYEQIQQMLDDLAARRA
jgi:PGM1 C-terminal domain/ATP-grasp domain